MAIIQPMFSRRAPGVQRAARASRAGEIAAQGGQKLAQDLGQSAAILDETRQRMAQAQAIEIEADRAKRLQDLLYNPETGYMHKKGKAAMAARQQIDDDIAALSSHGADAGGEVLGLIDQRWRDRLTRTQSQLDQHTRIETDRHTVSQLESLTATRAEAAVAALDFEEFQAAAGEIFNRQLDIVEITGESEEEARLRARSTVSGVVLAQIDGRLVEDRVVAAQSILEQRQRFMLSEDVTRAEKAIKSARKRLAAEAKARAAAERATYLAGFKDARAFVMAGGERPEQYTYDSLRSRLGTEEAGRLNDDLKTAEERGGMLRSVHGKPLDELATMLEEERAERDADFEGFRDDAAFVSDLESVIQEDLAARLADPAGYVLSYDGGAAEALRAWEATEDPEQRILAAQAYTDLVTAAQTAAGVPEEAQRTLPGAMRDQLASRIMEAPEGSRLPALIATRAQFGDRVLPELVAAGIPELDVVAINTDDPVSMRVREDAVLADVPEIKKSLDRAVVSDLDLALREEGGALEAWRLAFTDGKGDAARRAFEGYRQLAEGIAYSAAAQGMDPGAALDFAVRHTFGDFDLAETDEVRALVPLSSGLDADRVEDFAYDKLEWDELSAFIGDVDGATLDVRAAQQGRFVTYGDGKGGGGIYLIVPLSEEEGGGTTVFYNQKGERYQFSFEDIAGG